MTKKELRGRIEAIENYQATQFGMIEAISKRSLLLEELLAKALKLDMKSLAKQLKPK
jgi:hypothetical protein